MTEYPLAVVALVEYDGQILLGKKIKSKHFLTNQWHIPGGKVKQGETDEQALVREMREEAGIEVRVDRFLDEMSSDMTKFRARWYVCTALTHELKPGDDLVDARFAPKSEVFEICDPAAIALFPKEVLRYLVS